MTTLNDALVDIIQKTQGAVESGVSFLSQQIPEVIQQLLMWKLVESIVLLVVGLIAVVAYIVAVMAAVKYDSVVYAGDTTFPTALFGSFIGLTGAILGIFSVLEILQIYIAPKVWLIEYAAHLAK
jgi:uncharacterized membrane protein